MAVLKDISGNAAVIEARKALKTARQLNTAPFITAARTRRVAETEADLLKAIKAARSDKKAGSAKMDNGKMVKLLQEGVGT